MGGTCSCFKRKHTESPGEQPLNTSKTKDGSLDKGSETFDLPEADHVSQLYKEDKMTKVLNSASTYWRHYNEMSLFGSHRKVSRYSVDKFKGIYKKSSGVITEEVCNIQYLI